MLDNSVYFGLIGDFGLGNTYTYENGHIIKKLIDNDGLQFMIGLGDNIYPNGLDKNNYKKEILEKFTKPFANCEIPFYMVLGNHDYHGDINYQLDKNITDKRWILPNQYYDIILNDNGIYIHILFLDTNFVNLTSTERKLQKKWTLQRLNRFKGKADWTIIIGHHPWVSTGYHGNSVGELSGFYNYIISNYDIDFIINGHDHDKQLIIGKNNTKQLICGTGSQIRSFPTRNRTSNLKYFSESIGIITCRLFKKYARIRFLTQDGTNEYQQIFVGKKTRKKFLKKQSN